MNRTTLRSIFVVAVVSLFCARNSQAIEDQPLSFTFLQAGFAEGAMVTGSFTGVDLDGNGILVHFPLSEGGFPVEALELTDFSLNFSGNSLAPAFDLSLADLFGMVFEIESGDLGDDPAFDPTIDGTLIEGLGLIGTNYYYAAGQGPTSSDGGFVGVQVDGPNGDFVGNALDSSVQLIQVTRVPEPVAGGLLIAGIVVAQMFRRRR